MGYPKFNPLRDVFSGAIMATTSLPQLIAYAETAGYASYRGLATAGPSLVAWGLVTGSPYINSGVTSVTALMTKSDLNGDQYVAQYGEPAYVELVALYSIAVGIASILLALLGFGRLALKVPQAVRSGYKWGFAIGVLVAALPNGMFAKGSKDLKSIVPTSTPLFNHLPAGAVTLAHTAYALAHPWFWGPQTTVLFVLGTLFVMEGGKRLPKGLPPGTEVILLTAVAILYSNHAHYEGGIVGEIPTLDPDAGISVWGFRIPVEILDVHILLREVPLLERFGGSWIRLAVAACIFSAVNFVTTIGLASAFEVEEQIPWSPSRELMAQGISCCVAGATGSAPTSASLSRSLVSRMTGTTSQLACVFTALCWIYLQPYMGIMSSCPKAALSAVIVSAVVKGVFKPSELLKLTGPDAAVGWSTGVLTATTNPTSGFASGLLLYVILSYLQSGKKLKAN